MEKVSGDRTNRCLICRPGGGGGGGGSEKDNLHFFKFIKQWEFPFGRDEPVDRLSYPC